MLSVMRRKNLLIVIVLIALPHAVLAQSMLWPVADKETGTDILCKPQEYLEQQLNFGSLFIGGSEDDWVVSPADGVIQSIGVIYMNDLNSLLYGSFDPAMTLDENIRSTDFKQGLDPKYNNVSIAIALKDGSRLNISGLSGDIRFKTGQKVCAGDTLGQFAYSYKAFKEPSLKISISGRDGKAMDPMTPFGLASSFVAPGRLTRENPMPVEKLREDLTVLESAFCDLYPSLEAHMPEATFHAYMDSIRQTIKEPMDPGNPFSNILNRILSDFPDSHIYRYKDPVPGVGSGKFPGFYMMWCDDTLSVLLANEAYTKYEGRTVARVDGIPAEEYAHRFDSFVYLYDVGIESTLPEKKVQLGQFGSAMHLGEDKERKLDVEFSDGSHALVPFQKGTRPYKIGETYRRVFYWSVLNKKRSEDDIFEMKRLSDSVAYFALRTFDLNDVQLEAVLDSLAVCDLPNLIVDMRNNAGGDVKVLMKLLSCMTDSPMERQKGGYDRVKNQGCIDVLRYSLNYSADTEMFPEYEPRKGEDGFFCEDTIETCSVVMPDPEVHYGGRIYVLTNGHSYSAATLFPSVLIRNRRGVSVGRETGSGYHFMTALKFADIRLPNSLQTIRIPMVQLVFDTTVTARTPAGRGLLPDYPLPLSRYEVMQGDDGQTDVMLEYCLSLIAEGKYLSPEDPFAEADAPKTEPKSMTIWLAFSALVVLVLGAVILIKKRR